MIVLDTNVVSELMRQVPDDGVVRWVDRYSAEDVFITAVTAAELAHGVARLPEGRRKTILAARISDLLAEDFRDQILPFDSVAADYCGEIAATREANGHPIGMAAAQTAAICRRYVACLVTRNIKDFVDTGIKVLNPWDDAPEL
ncbi:VapC toxin family PIN domain ribonuclease [Saccharothrix sp. ALI-22-I]|uniref:type II toxin-antitoxin system VapC family toxin n=1 Tax=Saccharothrix sp. ALI-22-I TaxID=1933778 RepID=UPI00097C6F9A|nr:type II toxin-antitoxin system VapC family toxin [Saccharothrix sp. ALI-22-I]ONI88356.1 VapC toxin family PIN domain ribonuclease [Saccharothrix sp. ALI-22-I]